MALSFPTSNQALLTTLTSLLVKQISNHIILVSITQRFIFHPLNTLSKQKNVHIHSGKINLKKKSFKTQYYKSKIGI